MMRRRCNTRGLKIIHWLHLLLTCISNSSELNFTRRIARLKQPLDLFTGVGKSMASNFSIRAPWTTSLLCVGLLCTTRQQLSTVSGLMKGLHFQSTSLLLCTLSMKRRTHLRSYDRHPSWVSRPTKPDSSTFMAQSMPDSLGHLATLG